jgi:hypothetical protein
MPNTFYFIYRGSAAAESKMNDLILDPFDS